MGGYFENGRDSERWNECNCLGDVRPQDTRPFIFQTGTPVTAEVCETNNL